MARPKKKAAETRGKMLQVRLQGREYETFKGAAAKSGLDLSGWVRERLRQAAKKDLRDDTGAYTL